MLASEPSVPKTIIAHHIAVAIADISVIPLQCRKFSDTRARWIDRRTRPPHPLPTPQNPPLFPQKAEGMATVNFINFARSARAVLMAESLLDFARPPMQAPGNRR